MTPRINLYGGPGVGKSTLAAVIFAHLKTKNVSVELVQEFVKEYVYSGRSLTAWDQVYTFGQQIGRELHALQGGVEHIVTDSPLLLQYIYARRANCPSAELLSGICMEFETDYPSVNFFVRRSSDAYEQAGRWQDLSGAIDLDRTIETSLIFLKIPYTMIDPLIPASIEKCLTLLEFETS
jgi:hypothetical protein